MTLTITISETGSVVIPEAVREANGWTVGTKLELEERGRELVLRPLQDHDSRFPPVSWEEFVALIPKVEGPSITDEEIQEIVLEEAGRRFDAKTRS